MVEVGGTARERSNGCRAGGLGCDWGCGDWGGGWASAGCGPEEWGQTISRGTVRLVGRWALDTLVAYRQRVIMRERKA